MKLVDKKLLATFNVNPPASADAIHRFEAKSGMRLPEDYVAFLMQSNGGEGFIGTNYATLWRLEELAERNEGYKVADFAPGLFLFGSDGGSEAFAFDKRSDGEQIVLVPFIAMELSKVRALATNFNGFIERLFKSGLFDDDAVK